LSIESGKTDALVEYPDVEDVYDKAYLWGWSNDRYKELVRLCYKTPNLSENALRFADSEEFDQAETILRRLVGKASSEVNVLDYGCGNGIGSFALASRGYAVVGTDTSLGEVAGLKAAFKLVGLNGIQFKVTENVLQNDNLSNRFDAVWMREVLHHIKSIPSFLMDMRRFLKDGGILCCLRDVVIWNENQRRDFFDKHPFYPITQDEGCYYLKEYLGFFERAGFRLELMLRPSDSVINSYPVPLERSWLKRKMLSVKSRLSSQGYSLYSFFLRKI
jgi:SAM-dependent methyltransferase